MFIQNLVKVRFWIYLFALPPLSFFPVNAIQETQNINSFQALEDYFKNDDPSQEDTLLILDIDDVLIIPTDLICHSCNKKTFEEYLQPYLKNLPEDKHIEILSISLRMRKVQAVDPQSSLSINRLSKKKIKCIALTNAWTGTYGIIPSLEDLRIQELKSVGFDFSSTFPYVQTKIFTNLKSKDPSRFPMYKAGILWTCHLSKGLILKEFLEYISYKPKRIVFVDDKRKHIESVKQYCQEKNIKFQGFCYMKPSPPPFNEKIAQLQFDQLVKNKIWLSDTQVRSRLKKHAALRNGLPQ